MNPCKPPITPPLPQNLCGGDRPKSLISSPLANLISDYLTHFGDCYQHQERWWGDKSLSWNEAIERAWRSRFADGKMHPHQRRVSKRLEEGLNVARQDSTQPEAFASFEDLFEWVEAVTHRVKGLGVVTAYDVAQRLGMWLDISPQWVYLHAGTADGARHLGIVGDRAPLAAFPPEIQEIGAVHAENFLCIYKNALERLAIASFEDD